MYRLEYDNNEIKSLIIDSQDLLFIRKNYNNLSEEDARLWMYALTFSEYYLKGDIKITIPNNEKNKYLLNDVISIDWLINEDKYINYDIETKENELFELQEVLAHLENSHTNLISELEPKIKDRINKLSYSRKCYYKHKRKVKKLVR